MNTKTDWETLECSFEERAAILEYDAGYSRYTAEQSAAQQMGYTNKADLKRHIQKIKAETING
jgi:hypothetical protein